MYYLMKTFVTHLPVKLSIILCFSLFLNLFYPCLSYSGKEPKKRVAVISFENKARRWDRKWGDVSKGMTEMLVAKLIETEKFVVIERQDIEDVIKEQNLAKDGFIGSETAAKAGRLIGAQVLIKGIITDVRSTTDKTDDINLNPTNTKINLGPLGKVKIGKVSLGKSTAKVQLDLNVRLIDSTTGEILHSKSVEGIAIDKKTRYGLKAREIQFGTEAFQQLPIGKAIEDAIGKATDEIVEKMAEVVWRGSVVKVDGKKVYVNAGKDSNVEEGLELIVFEKGEELIDPETGQNLGSDDEEIGFIRIEKVRKKFSVGTILDGNGFEQGNIVRPSETQK